MDYSGVGDNYQQSLSEYVPRRYNCRYMRLWKDDKKVIEKKVICNKSLDLNSPKRISYSHIRRNNPNGPNLSHWKLFI